MQRLIEKLDRKLRRFIDRGREVAMVIRCAEAECPIVLKCMEAIEESTPWTFHWIFSEPFESADDYVDKVVASFAAKHEPVRLALARDPEARPWPEIPEELRTPTTPAVERLRRLMMFARGLLPDAEAVTVWVMLPTSISDAEAYTQLMAQLVWHEFPFPWCHHIRIVLRDSGPGPETAITRRLARAPRLAWYAVDLGPEKIASALADEAADESLPLPRRIQSVLILAGIDQGHQRHREALEKYELVLPYFVKTDNAAQVGLVLNQMGECHLALGDAKGAEFLFGRAVDPLMAADPPPVPLLLNVTLNLANLAFGTSRWAEAGVYYEAAEQLATAQLAPPVVIMCMENRGVAYAMERRFDEAVRVWATATALAAKAGEDDLRRRVLGRLQDYFAKSGNRQGWHEAQRQLAGMDAAGAQVA